MSQYHIVLNHSGDAGTGHAAGVRGQHALPHFDPPGGGGDVGLGRASGARGERGAMAPRLASNDGSRAAARQRIAHRIPPDAGRLARLVRLPAYLRLSVCYPSG